MNKISSSLTVRIFLITALILLAACTVTYLFLAWTTPYSYEAVTTDGLTEKYDMLLNSLSNVTLEESGPLLDSFIMDTNTMVIVFDENDVAVDLPISESLKARYEAYTVTSGDPVTPTDIGYSYSAKIVTEDFGIASDTDISAAYAKSTADGEEMSVISSDYDAWFCFKDSDTPYQLSLVYSITAVNQVAEAMTRMLPYLVLVVLLISFVGAVFYSRFITKPVVRLSKISQKMAELDFSWQCGEKRSDEIGVLGRNLDELSRRLSASLSELKDANVRLQADIDLERRLEKQRTDFFAAASHELKTPITVLKGQLSGMLAGIDVYKDRDKYLARSLAVTGRMEKLVQEILTISRMERAETEVRQEPVALSALVAAQLEQAGELAMQREQGISADISQGISVVGDERLLGLAVQNLLANASNYSPEGAGISVSLTKAETGAKLTVENSGAHIPEDALPHLFEAFYRVEGSRNRETGGSGLGLYLVKMVFDRHGAECRISNTEDGVIAEVVL